MFFVKNPQIKQCDVVDHFVKEGIAWKTVYNALIYIVYNAFIDAKMAN